MDERKAAQGLADAVTAILFQLAQGKVLERDACVTQAREALAEYLAAVPPAAVPNDEVARAGTPTAAAQEGTIDKG